MTSFVALAVVVRVEPLDGEKAAYHVELEAHPDTPPSWAAGMLRQIAAEIEPAGLHGGGGS